MGPIPDPRFQRRRNTPHREPLPRERSRMTARDIASALGGKRKDDGNYICHCPCPLHKHGDRNPSLSVKDGRNHLLLYCFAGGEYDEILKALEARGLRS